MAAVAAAPTSCSSPNDSGGAAKPSSVALPQAESCGGYGNTSSEGGSSSTYANAECVPYVEPSQKKVSAMIPEGVTPGVTKLAFTPDDGVRLQVTVPEGAAPGDKLSLTNDGRGSWKCSWTKRPQEKNISVIVPADATPGESIIRIEDGEGDRVGVQVPEAVRPGDLLKMSSTGFNADGSREWKCQAVIEVNGRTIRPVAPIEPISSDAVNLFATIDGEQAYENLRRALVAGGARISPKMRRGSAPPLFIRGIVCTERIEEGEELCWVPQRLHLDPRRVQAAHPNLWSSLKDLNEVPWQRRPEMAQASYLAWLLKDACERASSSAGQPFLPPEPAEWAVKGGGKNGEGDPDVIAVWERYAEILLDEDFADHPYRQAANDPERIRKMFAPSLHGEYLIDMSGDIAGIFNALTENVSKEVLGDEFEMELFFRARLCMLTRVFQTDQSSTLVPLSDLFNHNGAGMGASWGYDAEAQAHHVIACRAHEPGEEILISYGPRSNLLVHRTYGFTLAPQEEPAWSYVVQAEQVSRIYEKFLPEEDRKMQFLLETRLMDDSLSEIMNKVSKHGYDAGECLKLICARLKFTIDHDDQKLRPALEAFDRARAKDPTSHAWWLELEEADKDLINDVATRVKMGEYLCLAIYIEAIDCVRGQIDPGVCLAEGAKVRRTMSTALSCLARGIAFKIVLHEDDGEE